MGTASFMVEQHHCNPRHPIQSGLPACFGSKLCQNSSGT